jgi:putative ABC transport system permease protein
MRYFNLEKAIKTWLKKFQKHQAFDEGSMREMELHIRDHIEDLVGQGQSEEQAFDTASSSFGQVDQVAKEEFWNQQRQPSIKSVLFGAMVRNYYRTSIRTMMRNPLASFINVFGLAVAIGACLVVYASFEYDGRIDQFHVHKDQVFLSTHYVDRGGDLEQFGTSPAPLGPALLQDLAGVSAMTRVLDQAAVVKVGSEVYHETVRLVDPQFLDMFTFLLAKGSKSSLSDPNGIILSHQMAEKYFGDIDPIGKDLEIIYPNSANHTFEVSGVALPFLNSRTIDFDFLVNFKNVDSAVLGFRDDDWSQTLAATFIQLEDPSQLGHIKMQMEQYKELQSAANTDWPIQAFDFVSLAELHYATGTIKDDISFDSNAEARLGLPIMAGFMILLACINYINIAMKRLKEIGLRKVVGASRSQLIFQFLSENIVLTLFAFGVGMLLAMLVFLPWFIQLSGDPLTLSLLDPYLWLFGGVIVLITGTLSGLYPAVYISGFQSIEIFAGKLRFGHNSPMTKLFLGLQLIITCGSITCAIIFAQNNEFQQQRDWGYDKANMIYAKAPNAAGAKQLEDAMVQVSGVEQVALTQNHVGESQSRGIMHFPDREYEVDRLHVSADYLTTIGIPLSQGRYFTDHAAGDKNVVVVNQTLIDALSLTEPVGQVFNMDDERYTIIGVIDDFHSYSFFVEITPLLFAIADDNTMDYVAVRVAEQDKETVYAQLQDNWLQLFPLTPFQGGYQEDVWGNYFSMLYSAERFYTALALIAILLASLGLYGLITLNVTSRQREFSIRKVMGADLIDISKSVSRQYLVLCVLSLLIGLPFSYWLAEAALDMLYAYPMPLTVSGLLSAVFIVIFVLVLVLATQIRSVLLSNPASGLRTE